MIKSFYFMTAGFLSLFAAFGHGLFGHQIMLPQIENPIIRHGVFLFLHHTTWLMLASAGVFFYGSIRPRKVVPVALFIVLVFLGNFLFYLGASLIQLPSALGNLPQTLVFAVVYVGAILLGVRSTWKQEKQE